MRAVARSTSSQVKNAGAPGPSATSMAVALRSAGKAPRRAAKRLPFDGACGRGIGLIRCGRWAVWC